MKVLQVIIGPPGARAFAPPRLRRKLAQHELVAGIPSEPRQLGAAYANRVPNGESGSFIPNWPRRKTTGHYVVAAAYRR